MTIADMQREYEVRRIMELLSIGNTHRAIRMSDPEIIAYMRKQVYIKEVWKKILA